MAIGILSLRSIASVLQRTFKRKRKKMCNRTLKSVNTRPSNECLHVHEIAVIDSFLEHANHADAVAK